MKKFLSLSIAVTILLVAGCSETPTPNSPADSQQEQVTPFSKGGAQNDEATVIPGSYIVVLSSKLPDAASTTAVERLANLEGMITELRRNNKFDVTARYDACLTGFAANMDAMTAAALAKNPRVESIEPDRMIYAFVQTLPTGIDRIDADVSSTLAGNGWGTVTGVDVYIIDTGIQTNHPDLNVVGGINYSNGPSWRYDDGNGHGTHVAGTAAAKDNDGYVVGVAPGADLYAVRVLNNSGSGSFSSVLNGVNWVTTRKNATPLRAMVANMSLGAYSGTSSYNSLDVGVNNSITAGVVYCIAAGNSANNAIYYTPAHVTEALTIGAYNASNNTWASFSNYGSIVDFLAPGVYVLSTYKGSSTATLSGTSMSTPHVTGTAALYLSANTGATPALVRAALVTASTIPSPGPNPTITGIPSGTTNVSVYAGNF